MNTTTTLPIILDSFNLADAERELCAAALRAGGGIVPAAQLLGVTRHALKRRIIKHRIDWPCKTTEEIGGHNPDIAGDL